MSTIRRVATSRRRSALCCALLLAAGAATAQETRATVFGTVRDASGGVLPGVPVVVTNEETNVTNQAVTNASGAFEIPNLLPGSYRVTGSRSADGSTRGDR